MLRKMIPKWLKSDKNTFTVDKLINEQNFKNGGIFQQTLQRLRQFRMLQKLLSWFT